ncbi:BMP family ABC transporter substrate-binding protein [Fibrobacter sp.]|uniref:BMP family ABC transporter substrate-binding protein n=1 Tax=Fibrobacter sp. TaxID=35828 RepID=UPI00388D105D
MVLASILVFAMIVGVLVVSNPGEAPDETQQRNRVAMIMTGFRNDHSWNESHFDALQKAEKDLNLEVAYYENVPADSTAQGIMEQAIRNGAKIVIANSYGFGEAELQVARNHPEVKFFHATGLQSATNFSSFFGRVYQLRYLSGIVAGLKTKTNEIGYIAAYNIPEVIRGINAFALGVRKVNPKAKVYVSWSRSWTDESLAADATRDLLHKHHIDVLTAHVDALTPFEVADERGVWIIGYNKDNFKRFPKHYLTSLVWKWENFYIPKIREVFQDKFEGRNYWLGLESGIMELSEMTEFVDDAIRKTVEEERNRLVHGKFDVFYGPIEDNQGVVRVGVGESMTDDALLNRFDWFVKGVVDGVNP